MYEDDVHEPTKRPRVAFQGQVATTPDDESELIRVRIPSIDGGEHSYEARWTPRPTAGGIELPSEEDECLIMKDDQGEYWVLGWWPYG